MKKDPKTPGKLALNRETLRQLEAADLQNIAAGEETKTAFCPSAYQECTVSRRDCY